MTRNKHVKLHFETETSVRVGNLNIFLLPWSKSRVITVLHSQLYYHSHYKCFFYKKLSWKNFITRLLLIMQYINILSLSYRLNKSLKENYKKYIPIKYANLERHSGLFSAQTHAYIV